MVSVRRISALGMLVAFSSLLGLSSCLYDSSDRCDAGQAYDANAGLCVCTGNTIAGTTRGHPGCVACAEHEVASNDACVCEEGYQRPTPEAACVIVPDALGLACESDQDCTDATLRHLSPARRTVRAIAPTWVAQRASARAATPATPWRRPATARVRRTALENRAPPTTIAPGPRQPGAKPTSPMSVTSKAALWTATIVPARSAVIWRSPRAGWLKKTICVDPGTCKGAD